MNKIDTLLSVHFAILNNYLGKTNFNEPLLYFYTISHSTEINNHNSKSSITQTKGIH